MNPREMCDELHEKYLAWDMAMVVNGLKYKLTSVGRTKEVQAAYWAQGRETTAKVNALRKVAGLYRITDDENRHCVTWTMKSKHLMEPKSRAFDFVLLTDDGKADWACMDKYETAAAYAKSEGLEPGYYWKQRDACHIQLYG